MTTWMGVAKSLLGTTEIAGKKHNSVIVDFFRTIRLGGIKDDETPWCAAFVGHCLAKGGKDYLQSAWALNYSSYGVRLDGPRYGAIAYMSRKNAAGKVVGGHVAFVAGIRADGALMLLGGNQGNKVSIAPFEKTRIIGYRWPVYTPIPGTELPKFAMSGQPLSTNEA